MFALQSNTYCTHSKTKPSELFTRLMLIMQSDTHFSYAQKTSESTYPVSIEGIFYLLSKSRWYFVLHLILALQRNTYYSYAQKHVKINIFFSTYLIFTLERRERHVSCKGFFFLYPHFRFLSFVVRFSHCRKTQGAFVLHRHLISY